MLFNQTLQINSLSWGNLRDGFVELNPGALVSSIQIQNWNVTSQGTR